MLTDKDLLMKKFICLMLPLCLGLAGCQEEGGLLFNDKARIMLATDNTGRLGEYSYSFVWSEAGMVRDTVYLPVRVMGGPADADRVVALEQISEQNITYIKDHWGYVVDSVVTERTDKAVAGKHYVAFDDPEYRSLLTVPAGAVTSSIGVILLRDASLSEEKVRLRIRLQANDDFKQGESRFLERTITISDMLEQPANWVTRLMNNRLGTYSKAKHRLMIQVVGEGTKVDEAWIEQAYSSSSFLIYWRMKFIEALQAYNNDPTHIAAGLAPMREDENDPNSPLVTFPSNI